MNYRLIGKLMSRILGVEAVSMIPAFLICLYDKDSAPAAAFAITFGLIVVLAVILAILCNNEDSGFYVKEGLVCTSSAWIIISLLGALPFYFSGAIKSYINALFETVSGFTTTGASILADIDNMSRGLLYWRSFTHWLGGMGILVFVLTITSVKGSHTGVTLHLLRAESPGPDVEKIVPHMKKNSLILYGIYCILTIADILFLVAGRMPLFEAVCIAYGTAGTGGFAVKTSSLADYSSYIQVVTGIFMMLFGINFSLYYYILLKKIKTFFGNAELRLYLIIMAVSTAVISINIFSIYENAGVSLKHAFFQTSSIMTTTGFATVDFDAWPSLSKAIILVLMLIGACAGSTGGGLKCSRLIILIRTFIRSIRNSLNPNRVAVIKINGTTIPEKTIERTNTYLIIYVFIIFISFLVLSTDGFDMETNMSAVFACFNNVGPGFSIVGPAGNYSSFGVFSKLVLIFDMLAGRLEVIPIMALFAPSVWRRR